MTGAMLQIGSKRINLAQIIEMVPVQKEGPWTIGIVAANNSYYEIGEYETQAQAQEAVDNILCDADYRIINPRPARK